MGTGKYSADLIQRIGIDKLELYNFTVHHIDTDYLDGMPNVNISYVPNNSCPYIRVMEKSGIGIARIHIMDNLYFNELKVGCSINKDGELHEYCHLSLTVTNVKQYAPYPI